MQIFVDFEVSKQLHDYRVLIARLGSPSFRVVIKLAGPEAEYPCSFDQSAAIYQLLWCFEYAQPMERHITDTQRLCRQLGIQFSGRYEDT